MCIIELFKRMPYEMVKLLKIFFFKKEKDIYDSMWDLDTKEKLDNLR